MAKRYDPFRGMRAEKLAAMPSEEFLSMNVRKQAALVSKLASAANKRVASMTARGLRTPAVFTATRGGRFGAKGKTKAQLEAEFLRLRAFFAGPTTARKAEKWFKEFGNKTADQYGPDAREVFERNRERIAYLESVYMDRIKDMGYDSERARQMIYQYVYEDPYGDIENDIDWFDWFVDNERQEDKQLEEEIWGGNGVFDIYF